MDGAKISGWAGLIWRRLCGGVRQGLMAMFAALIAYVPTRWVGTHQGFWAPITAIAVVQMEFALAGTVARNQAFGGLIGGVVGLLLNMWLGDYFYVYLLTVLVSVIACWLLGVAAASQLAGITATIVMLVPELGTAKHVVASRLGEVSWGILAGVAVVWFTARFLPVRASAPAPNPAPGPRASVPAPSPHPPAARDDLKDASRDGPPAA